MFVFVWFGFWFGIGLVWFGFGSFGFVGVFFGFLWFFVYLFGFFVFCFFGGGVFWGCWGFLGRAGGLVGFLFVWGFCCNCVPRHNTALIPTERSRDDRYNGHSLRFFRHSMPGELGI